MITIHQDPGTNILMTTATGTLEQEDYEKLKPVVEQLTGQNEKIRWYFEMRNFEGWTPSALWSDAKIDLAHADDLEKIAVVGRKKWMDWMTQLMKPFTSAETRYFELEERDKAKAWIKN